MIEDLDEKIMEICNDRYECEKRNLDYNNVDYQEVKVYLLKEMLKQ